MRDYLFPPLLGTSRLITLTADTAFASSMLGAVVNLNGHTLTLSGTPEGYGFLVVVGAGDLAGVVTLELSSTQAIFVALQGGVFRFVEQADVDVAALEAAIALKAPLASPTFTGTPAAPTAAPGTNSTQLATCAYVFAGLSGKSDTGHTHSIGNITGLEAALAALEAADALKAPQASPTFTGTPTAPTAAPGTNTEQLATTAFVVAAISGLSGGGGGTWGSITGTLSSQADLAAALTDAKARANHTGTQAMATITGLDAAFTDAKARANHTGTQAIATVDGLQDALDAKAPLLSPAFLGTPTVPTADPGTDSAQAASTAFVKAAVAAGGGGLPVLSRTAEQGGPAAAVPATAATGTITFTGMPSNGEIITIGSVFYTAIASGPASTPYEFIIGASLTDSAQALLNAINTGSFGAGAYAHPLVTASRSSGVLTITAKTAGAAGNLIGLSESASNVAVSGANLTGGQDLVEATASQGVGQMMRVGPYALTGGRTEAYDWFIAETSGADADWRQIHHAISATPANILAQLATLDAGQIDELRAILEDARVMLAP